MAGYWGQADKRFIIAESFWIGSEILRRNPRWVLLETEAHGTYDCLMLKMGREETSAHVFLNRNGHISVFGGPGGSADYEWEDGMKSGDPHNLVKRIEAALGVQRPHPTPPTSRVTLGPRVIAAILTSRVHDRQRWDARNAYRDSDSGSSMGSLLDDQGVVLDRSLADAYLGEPGYAYWGLYRKAESLAVVCPDGVLRGNSLDEPFDFFAHYKKPGNDIYTTAAAVIAAIKA